MGSFNTGLNYEVESYFYPSGDSGGLTVFTNTSTYGIWFLLEADIDGSYVGGGHNLRGYRSRVNTITTTDVDWFSRSADYKRFYHPLFSTVDTDAITQAIMRERTFYAGEYLGFRGFGGTGSRFTVLKIDAAR